MPKFRFIAALALGMIALHYHHEGHTQQEVEAQPKEQQILQPVSPLANNGVSASQNDPGCKKDEENRNSDLCAQWKSADAAERSAKASERTVLIDGIGTAIGGLTFIAAVLAAVYARSAANHTKAGAEAANAAIQQAKEVAASEYRAWLVFDTPIVTRVHVGKNGGFDGGDGYLWIDYRLTIENVGRSPAREINLYRTLVGGINSHLMQPTLDEFQSTPHKPDGFDLAPNEKRELRLSGIVDFNIPQEDAKHFIMINALLGCKYIAIAGGDPVSSYRTYGVAQEQAAAPGASTLAGIDMIDVDNGTAVILFVAMGGKMD